MKMKWLFILIAVLITIILLSLFFTRINNGILIPSEKENNPAGEPQNISQSAQAQTPLPNQRIGSAITIIKTPLEAEESKQERKNNTAEFFPVPNAPAPAVTAPESTPGITKPGKQPTPEEAAKIKSKGIIIY